MGDLYCDLSSLVLLAVLVFYPSFGRVNSRLGNQRYAWFGSSWERVSVPTRVCESIFGFSSGIGMIGGMLSKAGLVWFFAVLVSSFILECRLIQLVGMKTDFIFIP